MHYHEVNKNTSNLVWILTQFKLKIKIKSLVAWSNFESWPDQKQTFNFVWPNSISGGELSDSVLI